MKRPLAIEFIKEDGKPFASEPIKTGLPSIPMDRNKTMLTLSAFIVLCVMGAIFAIYIMMSGETIENGIKNIKEKWNEEVKKQKKEMEMHDKACDMVGNFIDKIGTFMTNLDTCTD